MCPFSVAKTFSVSLLLAFFSDAFHELFEYRMRQDLVYRFSLHDGSNIHFEMDVAAFGRAFKTGGKTFVPTINIEGVYAFDLIHFKFVDRRQSVQILELFNQFSIYGMVIRKKLKSIS